MILLPIEIIKINQEKIDAIDNTIKEIYRLIIYSRFHLDDDLLDIYLEGIHDLKELLSIKNAQMEAQDDEEAEEYLKNLNESLNFVIDEIIDGNSFTSEIQLFQLLRLISPETNKLHPNSYRKSLVQIGAHICPEPNLVPNLISEMLYKIEKLKSPIVKAIYLHHELIRIHPFLDGNGRITRIAKNWLLMYSLYPPIFINDSIEKKLYISTLSNSFKELEKKPLQWNKYTSDFFDQELNRLLVNSRLLLKKIQEIGEKRKKI
jgi:Fic family protein